MGKGRERVRFSALYPSYFDQRGTPQTISERVLSGALYLPPQGQEPPIRLLGPEQSFYLSCLDAGTLGPFTIDYKKLRDERRVPIPASIGRLPDDSLYAKWKSSPLTEIALVDTSAEIIQTIKEARARDLGGRLIIDPNSGLENGWSTADFTDESTLDQRFGYIDKKRWHIRRIEMIADLAVHGIRDSLAKKGEATIVDFGSGIFATEKAIISKLTPQEREKVTFVGVDVSDDLLRYGLSTGLIDKGLKTNITGKTPEELDRFLPKTDVLIVSEILEHIPHVGTRFKESLEPWLRKNDTYMVGSIPNPFSIVDYLPALEGAGFSNVLDKPLDDENVDHYSHMTCASLAGLLEQTWGFSESGITSNAIPLDRESQAWELYAGLDYPHLGISLIFWGKYNESLPSAGDIFQST